MPKQDVPPDRQPRYAPRSLCYTFRATGITDYLTNGGRIEVAQKMAGHSNAKTTGLYDRRNDDISVGEVERIGI
jgi:integrase/recombinase XerD